MNKLVYNYNQWPFQEPKWEVPTIYRAYFLGLNFREYPIDYNHVSRGEFFLTTPVEATDMGSTMWVPSDSPSVAWTRRVG